MIENDRIEDHVIHLLHDLRSPRFPGSPRGAAHRAVPGEDLRAHSGGFKQSRVGP